MLVAVVVVAEAMIPDEPKSRVLAESEESGNTYGSDATLHHEEVDDDDESLLFSQGRGPLGNENDAIATPPPNTTETHGGSSSSITSLALSVVAVEELSADVVVVVVVVAALAETVTIISCSKNDVPPILRSNNADVKSIMELARRTPP